MDGRKPRSARYKVAILWRGDADARRTAAPQSSRFHRIFQELDALGIDAEPAVYAEEFADEVRAQLLSADGVLVWVDPIHQGRTRSALDALLREVAARGSWVSTHPDVTMKMGVKEVLHRTKHLGWGSTTPLCRSSGTPISFLDHAPPRAPTPTSCAKSMSARASHSPSRRRRQSPDWWRTGYAMREGMR
jgi:hypothetical protein